MYSKETITKEYLKGKTLRYSETSDSDIKSFIEKQINLNIPHKQKVYCFLNDIIPTCKNPKCDKIPEFQNFRIGYRDYCGVSCSVLCSKKNQEKTRIENIQEKVKDLTPEEIIKKLYHKELNIQKWRDIDKLEEYKKFRTLEQAYKHILHNNQICKYCHKVLDMNRKCNCSTKEERMIMDFEGSNEDFLKFIKDNNLIHAKNIEKEYYKRFEKLPWVKSVSENIYCHEHNISEQPETEFVDKFRGYKKSVYIIDYTKKPEEIFIQFKEKYGENYKRCIEFRYWVIHFEGESINECIENIKKGYIKDFSPKNNISFIDSRKEILSRHFLEEIDDNLYRCKTCDNIIDKPICRNCNPALKGFSKQEKEVLSFIESIYKGKILANNRDLGIELDIFLPELNIAIEYDGIYWHSARFKDKNYHLNKTNICEQHNIQLIHIFENEWLYKKEIVKSILRAKLNVLQNKIYARKCVLKEIPSKISNEFLDKNHIQGRDNSPIRYGLYFREELVQIMTLKRSHRSKEKYLELKRSASKINTNVVGGFSKLLKHIKKIYKEDIFTFADRRYSVKDCYYNKIGKYLSVVKPNYFYILGNELKSRESFQKHKLNKVLERYDNSLTEKENCHMNDIWEIYDSGNYKYVL